MIVDPDIINGKFEFYHKDSLELTEGENYKSLLKIINFYNNMFFSKFPVYFQDNIWIAGGHPSYMLATGSIPDEEKDIDLYSCNKATMETVLKFLQDPSTGIVRNEFHKPNAVSISKDFMDCYRTVKIDVVSKPYPNLLETLKTFDFIPIQCAVSKDTIVFHKDASSYYQARKVKMYNVQKDGMRILNRIIKYSSKGFVFSNNDLLDFLTLIQKDGIDYTQRRSAKDRFGDDAHYDEIGDSDDHDSHPIGKYNPPPTTDDDDVPF